MEDFWESCGVAFVIFSLCLGIGSCNYLTDKGQTLKIEATNKIERNII